MPNPLEELAEIRKAEGRMTAERFAEMLKSLMNEDEYSQLKVEGNSVTVLFD